MKLHEWLARLNSSEFRVSPAIGVTGAVWLAAILGSLLVTHILDDRRTDLEAQTRATIAQTDDVRLWSGQQDQILKSINLNRAAIDGDCKESRDMNASVMRLVQMLHDDRRGVVATASSLAAATPVPVAAQVPIPSSTPGSSPVPIVRATPIAAPAIQAYNLQVTLEGRYPGIIADLERLRATGRPISASTFTITRMDQGQHPGAGSTGLIPTVGDPKRVTLQIPLTVYFPPADACQPPQIALSGVLQ